MSPPLTGRPARLRSAIDTFLHDRLEGKLKGLADDDPQRDKLRAQYHRPAWVADAARRAPQIQLATHVLKATHPGAQGSSLFAPPATLPDHGLVGSRCLGERFDADVVGNAAALDIVQFLRVEVDGRSLLSLMAGPDVDLPLALSDDEAEARGWIAAFAAIGRPGATVSSHTLAKQVYWLVGDDPLDDEAYHLLAPLYASSLAHRVYQTIQTDRYGEAAQAARKARRLSEHSDTETRDYPDLAVQQLGGTKPQNISKLNSERRGVNYLLASLPPLWTLSAAKPPLHTDSVLRRFGRRSTVRAAVRALRRFLESGPPPTQPTRERTNQLAGQVVDEFFELELELHGLAPGWSAQPECRLVDAERHWLDPLRGESDADFAVQREQSDWPADLAARFANWLNDELSGRLAFDDGSYGHWHALLLDELRARQREGLRHA